MHETLTFTELRKAMAMGQINKEFAENIIKLSEEGKHAALTTWEKEQLANAWLRLRAVREVLGFGELLCQVNDLHQEVDSLLSSVVPTKFNADVSEFTRGWNACVDVMLQRGPKGSAASVNLGDAGAGAAQADPHHYAAPEEGQSFEASPQGGQAEPPVAAP